MFVELAPEGRAADSQFRCGHSFATVVFGQCRHNLFAFYLPQRRLSGERFAGRRLAPQFGGEIVERQHGIFSYDERVLDDIP